MTDPFFIVGCGRSGTTLLRALLNRHPDVAIPLESLFIIDYLRASRSRPLGQLISMMTSEPEIEEWGLEISAAEFDDCDSMQMVIAALQQKYAHQHGKSRSGQKTPRFVRHMGLILESFPNGQFIHMVRDPRAVANSLIQSDVHHSNAFFGSRRWVKDVTMGMRFEELHPDRILRVSYEHLVSEPGATLHAICDFLHLPWLAGSWWKRGDDPASDYSAFYDNIHHKLSGPISTDSISKWKHQLSPVEVDVVEAITAPLMDKLGYVRERGHPQLARWRIPLYWLDRVFGLLKQARKYLAQRRGYLAHLVIRKARFGLLLDFLREANY